MKSKERGVSPNGDAFQHNDIVDFGSIDFSDEVSEEIIQPEPVKKPVTEVKKDVVTNPTQPKVVQKKQSVTQRTVNQQTVNKAIHQPQAQVNTQVQTNNMPQVKRTQNNQVVSNPSVVQNNNLPVQAKKKGFLSKSPKEKKPKVKKPMTVKKAVAMTIFSMSVVFSLGCGTYYYASVYVPPAIVKDYNSSGTKPLDVLEKSLREYNISDLNNQISSEKSWILQEVDYANGSKPRLGFIQKILANVKFEYPQMQAQNKRGLMYDKAGNPVMVESDMTHNEKVAVTHIDYNALANTFQENRDEILKLVASHGYTKTDYLYKDEMIDTMIEYVSTIKELPLTTDEVKIPLQNKPIITTNEKGKQTSTDNYIIKDDSELDKILFSSDEFHRMCDSFAMVITGWKPTITQQEQDNPEYAKYQRGIADGTISANTTAPDKKIMVNVVTGDSFPSEEVVPYTWIGAYYLQHEYKDGKTVVMPQVGNGTFEKPAGINTVVVTKAIDTSGYAHDIKLTLNNIWREQDAIDYLAKFSEQNRGISNTANVKMLCAEFTVQNLSSSTITIKEDMALCDKSGNMSSKTGNIYGLTEELTLAPLESKVVQAWTSSTELDRKYLIWGRSYNKQYPSTWFKVLAGDKDAKTDKKDDDNSTADKTKEDNKSADTKTTYSKSK